MHVNTQDIKEMLAPVYYDACLGEDTDMQLLVPQLEEIKKSIISLDTLACWDRIRLDNSRFGSEPYLSLFNRLKKSFNTVATNNTIAFLKKINTEAPGNFYSAWMNEFAEAIINWHSSTCEALFSADFFFTPQQTDEVENCRLLFGYVMDNKWAEAYKFYAAFANHNLFTANQKSCFEVYAGQIRLYWFSKQQTALNHFTRAKELDPHNHKAERGLGEYYLKNNDYERARSYILSAISMQPNDPETYLYMGDTYRLEGKTDVAIKWINDGLQVNFLSSNVYSRLIEAYSDERFSATQEELIAAIIAKAKNLYSSDPTSNELYNLLRDAGSSVSKNLHYEASENYYNQAIALRPELSSARLDLGYIYAYQKKFEESEKCLKMAESIIFPGYEFDINWALGWLYDQWDKPTRALEYYKNCLAFTVELKDRVYNITGIIYYNQKQYSEAAINYEEAIKDNPYEKIYYDNCRRAYEDLKDAASLPLLYKKAVDHLQTDGTYPNYLGVSYHDKGDYETAIVYYNIAIEREQNNALYYTNRGLAHESIKNLDAAEEDYRQAYNFENTAEAANRIGSVLYLKEQYDNAIAFYNDAISKNNSSPLFTANLASCYEKLGNFEKAEELLLHAITLSGDAYYQNTLALLYYNNKRSKQAIKYYKKAMELEPHNNIYAENLMLAYLDTKQYDEAEKLLETLYAYDNTNGTMLDYLLLCKIKLLKYDEALQALNAAPVSITEKISMLRGIGKLQEEKEKFSDALNTYHTALLLDDNSEYFNNRAGIMLYRLGGDENLRASLMYYQKAIDAGPETAVYYQNISLSYHLLAEAEPAEKAILKAIDLEPNNADALNTAGVFYADHNQDFREAIRYYKKAIEVNPNDPLYFANMALSYTSLDDEENASIMQKKSEELKAVAVNTK